jgi:hypothetical protein
MAIKTTTATKPAKKKVVAPTGVASIDELVDLPDAECTIDAYVKAASEYVRRSHELKLGPKKAAQIRLSNALGRALVVDLKVRIPSLQDVVIGERKVSGALRSVNADVSEIHSTDGLRLAVELKPVNLAVGRAIWNRFGDIRTFAVNLHLKFPFCVVGGVLAIPTYEATGSKAEIEAEVADEPSLSAEADEASLEVVASVEADTAAPPTIAHRSTVHLINRAVARLVRAGGRRTEGDAPHLLEGIAVVVYDPDTGTLHQELPAAGSGLRWSEFVDSIATTYQSRFEL